MVGCMVAIRRAFPGDYASAESLLEQSGLPRVVAGLMMPVIGSQLQNRDPRPFMVWGIVSVTFALFLLTHFSVQTTYWDLFWPLLIRGLGMAALFIPINAVVLGLPGPGFGPGRRTVEEAPTMGLEIEFTEGMQFDKGYISAYFITDQDRMEAVLEDVHILLHGGKISSMADFLPLLEQVAQGKKTLLVIAEDVDGEALSTLVVNKIRGLLTVAAVKAPGFGDRRKAMLEDMAVLTGGSVVSEEVGLKLENVGLETLGHARRVVVTKDTTTIVDGDGEQEAIDDRIRQLRAEIENSDSDWDREKLQERVAKLSGGVCVLRAGAATEVELKEKKHRLEDAISATRAAIEEGIIPGGGSALVQVARGLGDLGKSGDELTGVNVVRSALEAPCRWIAQNAGAEGGVVISAVADLPAGHGYNAQTGEYGDLMAQGVIDPVKVTRSAVQNAASIAGMLLSTEVLVTEKPEPEAAAANGQGHGHSH